MMVEAGEVPKDARDKIREQAAAMAARDNGVNIRDQTLSIDGDDEAMPS